MHHQTNAELFPVEQFHKLTLGAKSTLHGLKMFSLLSVWILAGVMAEGRISTYYQLKNGSLCLHVRHPPPYKSTSWKMAGKFIGVDGEINPDYKDKVSDNDISRSLCLKELTDADAGIYQVSFRDSEFNVIEEKHEIIIEEVVPQPVITVSVVHSNLSAGFCRITVNCSIWDDWVLANCDEQSCRSSQTSFTKEQACNAQLIENQSIEAQSHPEPRASTSSSSGAEASYENVDASQPRQTSSPREEMGSMPNDKVDTVYSTLQAANVAPSCGKSDRGKDMKGHKTNHQASTSQAVIVDEAECPTQIDTVYSVLQKPTNVKSQHHQQVT
ncbi:hypothetical protein INR49_002853 [Caranx melampygus]|nr:hypothetical protein INR49_002853 [Caranx melampygus]